MPQSQRDGETGRRGDWATGRKIPPVAQSPRRPVSPSLHLSISLSLCLCVSVANSSAQAQHEPAQGAPAIEDPAARVTETLAGAVRLAAEILAIEDPAARDAALRKLHETGAASEQIQAAREAVVTKWAQLAESA